MPLAPEASEIRVFASPSTLIFEAPVASSVSDSDLTFVSVPVDAPNVVSSGLEEEIRDGLDGRRVSCGSFVGVWAPRE